MDNVDYKGLIFTVSQFKFWEILILKEKIYILDNKGHALAKHPPIWLFLEAGKSQSWKPNNLHKIKVVGLSSNPVLRITQWSVEIEIWQETVFPDILMYLIALVSCYTVVALCVASFSTVVWGKLCLAHYAMIFKTEPWLQPHPSNCFRRPTASWTLMPNTVVDLIEVCHHCVWRRPDPCRFQKKLP